MRHEYRAEVTNFSSIAAAYKQNAKVNIANATIQQRLRLWRPKSNLLGDSFRFLSPLAVGCSVERLWVIDHQIVYLEGGKRGQDPVLLLHGFGSNKENWIPLIPLLKSRYWIIAPDLPGFGETHFNYQADYSLSEQAERIAHFITHHIQSKVHLVGNSMGGAIAGLLAAKYPHLLHSLTLMNAAGVVGKDLSPFEDALMFRHAHPVMRAMFLWHAVEEVEHKAVAYDVYEKVAGGGYLIRVSALLVGTALVHVVVGRVLWHMLKVDGLTGRPLVIIRGLYKLYGPNGMLTGLIRPYLAWFKPGFHPWDSGIPEKVSAWLEEYDRHGDPMEASRRVFEETH